MSFAVSPSISMAPSPQPVVCDIPSRSLLLATAFRSLFIVFATHILSGHVDTNLPQSAFAWNLSWLRSLAKKLSWLVRYYNPVNLCWRYYSMLAYRCMHRCYITHAQYAATPAATLQLTRTGINFDQAHPEERDEIPLREGRGRGSGSGSGSTSASASGSSSSPGPPPTAEESWGALQLALINFEALPYEPPIPYIVGEKLANGRVKRLEISGLVSSQGLLSFIAAYEGVMAIHFTVTARDPALLPTIAKPLAILGLFRAMVSKWVADKVYVDTYEYPHPSSLDINNLINGCSCNKFVAFAWFAVGISLLLLSLWNFVGTGGKRNVGHSMQVLYAYLVITIFLYHIVLLTRGPIALANRIPFFNDWHYKLQTLGFVLLFLTTVCVGLWDFLSKDFYISCFSNYHNIP